MSFRETGCFRSIVPEATRLLIMTENNVFVAKTYVLFAMSFVVLVLRGRLGSGAQNSVFRRSRGIFLS